MRFKNSIVLFLCCFLLHCGGVVAFVCDPSPEIRCINVAVNGNTTITWQNPSPQTNFVKHYIYSSFNKNGPYVVIDSIFSSATTTYNHIGAGANSKSVYYYIETACPGGGANASAIDTLSSIFLVVNNPGNGKAQLNWNSMHQPPKASSMGWYRIYREYPMGTWTLIDSTKSQSYVDTITICRAQINYKIELGDFSGCTSVSSVAGGIFVDVIVPATPIIDSVSVNAVGSATIGWNVSPSGDTKGYVVYQLINGIWISIDTVYGKTNTFYNNVNSQALSTIENYRVAAFDSCRNTSPQGIPHNSILLKSVANPCARLNTLSWNVYGDMVTGVKQYDISVSTNGGPFIYLGTSPATSTTFVHTNLQQTFVYCYVVQARDNSGTRSATSNRYCYTANIPPAPTFSYLKSVTVPSNNQVDVSCYVDVAAAIKKYKVLRSESPSGPFSLIGAIPFTGNPIVSYTDKTAKTSEHSYYYKTVAVDTCDNDTTVTNIGRTILLTAVANDNRTNTLNWNDYELWLGSVNSYNVYRAVNGVWDSAPITNIPYATSGTNSFIDDVSNFYPGDGVFSYYVFALEDAGNPYGIMDSSRSNVAQALQDAKVFIPNAFAPTGINNVFIPVITYVDKTEYDFRIYNRWGEQIFETNDPYIPWDGTVGGKKAEGNVYVYLLKFKTAYGEYIERSGIVTLLR